MKSEVVLARSDCSPEPDPGLSCCSEALWPSLSPQGHPGDRRSSSGEGLWPEKFASMSSEGVGGFGAANVVVSALG